MRPAPCLFLVTACATATDTGQKQSFFGTEPSESDTDTDADSDTDTDADTDSDTDSDSDTDVPVFDCAKVPDEIVDISELDAPRGYHDVAFDAKGNLLGSDGKNLTASSDASSSTDLGAERRRHPGHGHAARRRRRRGELRRGPADRPRRRQVRAVERSVHVRGHDRARWHGLHGDRYAGGRHRSRYRGLGGVRAAASEGRCAHVRVQSRLRSDVRGHDLRRTRTCTPSISTRACSRLATRTCSQRTWA